ncbi:TIGR04540 family protein [Clostridium celatum]|uniref:TIGR04540 family protein n=1 Tax=Clostridium celatum TaxID=36834 RepID=UPI001896CB4B|nr:TIGR04540 family protein [Clostridium celatum]MCE9656876.1 TIGR04540 family protein [Clostridium celatum]MDU2264835.1 TIGR04540 family protein [Clostridium celatum]MDU3723839.1 TIGR04540 family protein [Clostridium celatum]MDY3360188.1 TIGR04540 family protein [Clostridium celatum]
MRAVYRNPKELATKLKDLVDLYQDDLLAYEKLEATIVTMIKANDDRIYKNGFMPTKLISAIGEERKSIIDKIAQENNL